MARRRARSSTNARPSSACSEPTTSAKASRPSSASGRPSGVMAEAAAMSDPCVLFSTIPAGSGHGFGRATLDAPASLNALSLAMVDALAAQLAAWAADPGIVGVLLDGAGDKAFCAGGDVVALHRSIRGTEPGQVPTDAARFFEHEYR